MEILNTWYIIVSLNKEKHKTQLIVVNSDDDDD